MAAPFFSVVIPTYLREESLLACLQSLEGQTFPVEKFEVIIADDAESKATHPLIEGFMAGTTLRIQLLHTERAGPGGARNEAVRLAQGQVVAFTEDDVTLDSHWLERAARHFESLLVVAVEGKTMIKGVSGELRLFERERQYSFIPCNFFIRRDVFNALGGYDPEFFDLQMGLYFREDADLGFRLLAAGKRVVIANDVVAYHPELYHRTADYFRHVKRYYFDPLLHRKHAGLYRSMIEVKQLGGMTVRRPFHYLCLAYIAALFIALLFYLIGIPIFAILFLLLGLSTQYPMRLRYERTNIPPFWDLRKTFAFLALPFYYLYWILKGCQRFKNWSVIL